jgi:hypothetical protein
MGCGKVACGVFFKGTRIFRAVQELLSYSAMSVSTAIAAVVNKFLGGEKSH